jgi:hypothetical protein
LVNFIYSSTKDLDSSSLATPVGNWVRTSSGIIVIARIPQK